MIEEYELPMKWLWTTIGEVAETTSGGTPSRHSSEYYNGTIPWVKSGELEDNVITNVEEFITEEGLKNSNAKVFHQGTALVAMYGATVGKTGILGIDATTNQAICAIFPRQNAFISKFIVYWLQAQRQTLIDQSFGGAQPNINQGIIRAFPMPLTPIPEQHRIVAAIEEQFTRLDAAVTALQHARTKLKRYRAAVLKAAVEGKLTEAWRAEHPATEPGSVLLERILVERRAKWEADLRAKGKDPAKVKYVEPARPDVESLPELPGGWCWATINQIVSRSEYGTSVKCDYKANGVPVLRIPNIAAGEIDTSDMKYSLQSLALNEDNALQVGDLLVCRTNGSVSLIGKTALIQIPLEPFHTFASYLLRFRLLETTILPKWLHLFLSSPQGRKFIESNAASSAGQHNISLTLMHSMCFSIPPLLEQEQIVTEVERRLSIVTQLETTVEANLKRAERLRQSILKEAFAGRLVPQYPHDEPASMLLERIQKEREGQKRGSIKKSRELKTISAPRMPDVEPIDIDASEMDLWANAPG